MNRIIVKYLKYFNKIILKIIKRNNSISDILPLKSLSVLIYLEGF